MLGSCTARMASGASWPSARASTAGWTRWWPTLAVGAAERPPRPPPSAHCYRPPPAISLEKRIEDEAPQLVNLVKQAGVSLAKGRPVAHRAKVAWCSTFPAP